MTKVIYLGFSGKIGSGKTTTANAVQEQLKKIYGESVYVKHMNFATRLKQLAAHIFRFPENLCYSNKGYFVESAGMTVGQILQTLGKSFRQAFGQNFWLEELRRSAEDVVNCLSTQTKLCIFLIGDVRYPNEADFLQDKQGAVLRLIGDPAGVRAASRRDLTHESETALDEYEKFDLKIMTDESDVESIAEQCILMLCTKYDLHNKLISE